MEKPPRTKSGILSFLPKSAAISFSSHPFSPGREKHKSHINNKAFSGPIISIVPVEARAKTTRNGSFHCQEPTSPKVSCIGQIKHRKKGFKSKSKKLEKLEKEKGGGSSGSIMRRLFSSKKINGRKVGGGKMKEEVLNGAPNHGREPPSLGQLRKFSSGREAFSDFDWRFGAGGGPAAALGRQRGYFSDEEKADNDDDDDDDNNNEDDDIDYGFSVPRSTSLGGSRVGRMTAFEPKKEISIWKKRTMAPPKPLQV